VEEAVLEAGAMVLALLVAVVLLVVIEEVQHL
jgi:hypothetical protein